MTFEEPVARFGLTTGKSTFKIINKGIEHVLIKKKNVGWNGSKKEIPLTEIARSERRCSTRTSGSKPRSTFEGNEYVVSFGSDNNGLSLKIQAVGEELQTNPGGTGDCAGGGG